MPRGPNATPARIPNRMKARVAPKTRRQREGTPGPDPVGRPSGAWKTKRRRNNGKKRKITYAYLLFLPVVVLNAS
jgi:hypothetical protein